MTPAQDDGTPRRAMRDLARAEANLRHDVLAPSAEGIDHVAAAERALDARAAGGRVAPARPRGGATESEGKSWGSH